MNWDREQINGLAPDAASIKAAQKLISINKWPLRQYNDRAIWGHCQGSGKNPYLTRIDLNEPAFKCSCPSRKFPCKHGLALFTLYAENQIEFEPLAQPPDWVLEWLDGRDDRQQKKVERAANPKPVDEAAQLKRQQERQDKVSGGIAELKRYLEDIIQVGIADLPNKSYDYFESLAARMIDAQAPGLAARVKTLGAIANSGKDVMPRLVNYIGELNLLLQAYERIETIPELLQTDVKHYIGFTQAKESVLTNDGVEDQWLVLGVFRKVEDKLVNQTCYLHGVKSGRNALVIQFAHSSQSATLSNGWQAGSMVQGFIHFYPSSTPLRALDGKVEVKPCAGLQPQSFFNLPSMLREYHRLKQLNPWLINHVFCLDKVIVTYHNEKWYVTTADADEQGLELNVQQCEPWLLMAHSGGHPVALSVEFDGTKVSPIGVWSAQQYHSVLKKGGQE